MRHDDKRDINDGLIQPGALEQYNKSFGLVVVPVYDKVGISTSKSVNAVVNTIFNKGEPAISLWLKEEYTKMNICPVTSGSII